MNQGKQQWILFHTFQFFTPSSPFLFTITLFTNLNQS